MRRFLSRGVAGVLIAYFIGARRVWILFTMLHTSR